MSKKVAVVATSATDLNGTPTGCWAEEIMAPILTFKEKGYDVKVFSVAGGKVPIDAASMADGFRTEEVDTFMGQDTTKTLLDETAPVSEAAAADFDAVFIPGGHGVCADMPDCVPLQDFVTTLADQGKVVASVCHGPAAFANMMLSNGEPLVKGKKVTGFTNTEEEAVGKTGIVPFLLEDKLKELGGEYSRGEADWASYAVVDGNLITGQNPGSSKAVAAHMVEILG